MRAATSAPAGANSRRARPDDQDGTARRDDPTGRPVSAVPAAVPPAVPAQETRLARDSNQSILTRRLLDLGFDPERPHSNGGNSDDDGAMRQASDAQPALGLSLPSPQSSDQEVPPPPIIDEAGPGIRSVSRSAWLVQSASLEAVCYRDEQFREDPFSRTDASSSTTATALPPLPPPPPLPVAGAVAVDPDYWQDEPDLAALNRAVLVPGMSLEQAASVLTGRSRPACLPLTGQDRQVFSGESLLFSSAASPDPSAATASAGRLGATSGPDSRAAETEATCLLLPGTDEGVDVAALTQ